MSADLPHRRPNRFLARRATHAPQHARHGTEADGSPAFRPSRQHRSRGSARPRQTRKTAGVTCRKPLRQLSLFGFSSCELRCWLRLLGAAAGSTGAQ
jgi:hypothetical protein